jgi:hypothetical protein
VITEPCAPVSQMAVNSFEIFFSFAINIFVVMSKTIFLEIYGERFLLLHLNITLGEWNVCV